MVFLHHVIDIHCWTMLGPGLLVHTCQCRFWLLALSQNRCQQQQNVAVGCHQIRVTLQCTSPKPSLPGYACNAMFQNVWSSIRQEVASDSAACQRSLTNLPWKNQNDQWGKGLLHWTWSKGASITFSQCRWPLFRPSCLIVILTSAEPSFLLAVAIQVTRQKNRSHKWIYILTIEYRKSEHDPHRTVDLANTWPFYATIVAEIAHGSAWSRRCLPVRRADWIWRLYHPIIIGQKPTNYQDIRHCHCIYFSSCLDTFWHYRFVSTTQFWDMNRCTICVRQPS